MRRGAVVGMRVQYGARVMSPGFRKRTTYERTERKKASMLLLTSKTALTSFLHPFPVGVKKPARKSLWRSDARFKSI